MPTVCQAVLRITSPGLNFVHVRCVCGCYETYCSTLDRQSVCAGYEYTK